MGCFSLWFFHAYMIYTPMNIGLQWFIAYDLKTIIKTNTKKVMKRTDSYR